MLDGCEISGMDPVAEAFRAYDINNEGSIAPSRLKEVFFHFGFGELSDSELQILVRAADVDGDGVVSLEDFRYMLDMHKQMSKKFRSLNYFTD